MPSVEEFARDDEEWEAIANVREHCKLTEQIIKRSKKKTRNIVDVNGNNKW